MFKFLSLTADPALVAVPSYGTLPVCRIRSDLVFYQSTSRIFGCLYGVDRAKEECVRRISFVGGFARKEAAHSNMLPHILYQCEDLSLIHQQAGE